SRLSAASNFPVNRELTLYALIGNQMATRGLQLVVAGWTCFLAFRFRRRAPQWIYAAALVGGMLASPYLHLDDLLMLGLAAWLVLRTGIGGWTLGYMLLAVISVEGLPIWGPLPVIAAELAGLALLSWAAFKPEVATRSPHAGPHPGRTGELPRATRPTR
ncbi:MAG: hypothetical protein ACHQ0J_07610, partial [Candidatus Dormibacterales bacterium]